MVKTIFGFKVGFVARVVFLLVLNGLLLVGILILVLELPKKAGEIAQIRSERIRTVEDVEIASFEVGQALEKTVRLEGLFADENGLLNFYNRMDEIKAEGVVSGYSFIGNDALRDRSGYAVLPFSVKMLGSWEQIKSTLNKISGLGYMTRAVKVDYGLTEEGLVDFSYGGVLYVSSNFTQN